MDNLTNEFINIYGIEKYNKIEEYIKDNNLNDEFNKATGDMDKLFEFSIDYGIIDLVQFLFEFKELTFNFDIVTKYYKTIGERNSQDNLINVPIINQNGGRNGLNIKIEDRFSSMRNQCII